MPKDVYFQELCESIQLGRQAVRGGVISVLGTYGSGVLQIFAAVVLARLLTPEDFGLVAILTVLTSFAPSLIDFGLGDATILRKKITEEQVSSLFWVSIAIGAGIALVVAISGPVIAWIYREPRLESVALLSAIPFVLMGMSGQHLALLRRSMQFTAIARIQILATVAGIAAAILLAMFGFGYWALMLRPIVSTLWVVAGAWLACPWRPVGLVFDGEVASMVRFGRQVVGYSVALAIARSVDRIALGLIYRPYEVGLYQNALVLYDNSIVSALAQVHNVGSAALGNLQANMDGLKQKYHAALSVLAFFVMPAAAILSVTAQDIVVTLLGEKWRMSGLLLSIFALRGMFHVIHSSHGWLHLAIGRPDRWRNWGIITVFVQVVAVVVGLSFGLVGMAVAVSLAGCLIAFPAVSYAGKPVGIDAASAFQTVKRQLVGAILTAVVGWLLQWTFLSDFSSLSRILLSVGFCALFYLSLVVGLFRLTEPIKVASHILSNYLPTRGT
jgi:O-antigen/teichoic acid export membrane protein